MKNLEKPKSQITEVLYFLIKNDKITFKYIYSQCGILNLSARLSDLKNDYDLPIECVSVKTKNKFDRSITYGSWRLNDKEKAIGVYNKLINSTL